MKQIHQKAIKLSKELFLSDPITSKLVKEFEEVSVKVAKWVEGEGNLGIVRAKEIYGFLTRYALDESPVWDQSKIWMKTDSFGCPIHIREACTILRANRGNSKLITKILSAYQFHNWFTTKLTDRQVESSLATIVDTGEAIDSQITNDFAKFLSEFSDQYARDPIGKKLLNGLRTLSRAVVKSDGPLNLSKKGPNGVYIQNYEKDFYVLREGSGREAGLYMNMLANLILEDCGLKGSYTFFQDGFIKEHVDYLNFIPEGVKRSWKPGKIGLIAERAGKLRLIAQPTYFHQRVLQPIHDTLMDTLSAFPTDCTVDQAKGVKLMQQWQEEGCEFMASYDHSACTDLFPVKIQASVLEMLVGPNIAQAWLGLCESSTFEVEFPQSKKVRTVKYGRGQPMGMLSSWPAMALSHHMLVHFATWLACGKALPNKMFRHYAVLGDDVVISDRKVAHNYLKVVKALGMKVNITKSHVSERPQGSSNNILGEFAKRLVMNGVEISPVPWKLLYGACKDHKLVPLLWRYLARGQLYPSKKLAERILQQYWPKAYTGEFSFLLTLPSDKGGFGYRTNESRYVHQGGLVHSVELLLKAYKVFKYNEASKPQIGRVQTLIETEIDHDCGLLNLKTGLFRRVLTEGYRPTRLPNQIDKLGEFDLFYKSLDPDHFFHCGDVVKEFHELWDELNHSPARVDISLRPFEVEVRECREVVSCLQKHSHLLQMDSSASDGYRWEFAY